VALCPPASTVVAPIDGARCYNHDNLFVTITFAGGPVGTIHYLADGSTVVGKEYLEVFGDRKTARLWNFNQFECAIGREPARSTFSGDKGHAAEMRRCWRRSNPVLALG
jgi:hypothetical protein